MSCLEIFLDLNEHEHCRERLQVIEGRGMFLFKANRAVISIVTFLWGKENFKITIALIESSKMSDIDCILFIQDFCSFLHRIGLEFCGRRILRNCFRVRMGKITNIKTRKIKIQ